MQILKWDQTLKCFSFAKRRCKCPIQINLVLLQSSGRDAFWVLNYSASLLETTMRNIIKLVITKFRFEHQASFSDLPMKLLAFTMRSRSGITSSDVSLAFYFGSFYLGNIKEVCLGWLMNFNWACFKIPRIYKWSHTVFVWAKLRGVF